MELVVPKIVKLVGVRPPNMPEDWLIFNAARPLSGNVVWEGDFFFGNHYAAVHPGDPHAAFITQNNAESGAVQLHYLTAEAAIAEQMAWYEEHAPELAGQVDLTDEDIRRKVIVGWRNRQRVEYPPRGGEAL